MRPTPAAEAKARPFTRPASAVRRAESVLALALVAAAFATDAPAATYPAGDPSPLRQKQTIRTALVGVERPGGIAYLPGSDLFAIAPQRPGPAGSSLTLMTKFRERAGVVSLPFAIAEPRAMAFDAHRDRLLVLDAAARALHAVPADPTSGLDPARSTRLEAPRAGLIRPVGMAVDAATGEVFVLDRLSRRILRFTPGEVGQAPEARWIDLGPLAPGDLAGLAYDSASRHFFTLEMKSRVLYELAEDGHEVGAFDAASLVLRRPGGLVLAPSGDQTDDPATLSVFCADPGASAVDRGLVLEMAWPAPPAEATPARIAAPAAITPTLVRNVATSAWSPSSPDPSGITYDPATNRLLVVDGEVEEMTIWANRNAWETTLAGVVQRNANLTNFTIEPVGAAINAANRHVFISDDDDRRVWEITLGPDNLFGTGDDTRRSFSTTAFGDGDPEGCSYDRLNNRLFLVDGLNMEVYVLAAGPNGVIDGGGDDIITHFDTGKFGVDDPETVEFKEDTGTLLLVGHTNKDVVEVTTTGAVVSATDISFAPLSHPAGLAYAPSSADATKRSWYIVNRGVDNDSNPKENDGTLIEIALGGSTPPPGSGTDWRISAGSDDAEEKAGGNVTLTSGDLELVYDGSLQTVGLLFRNVTIPKGASIATAWIQFQADEAQSEATSLVIRGQAADNATTFTTASGNISGRPRGAATVTWSPAAWTVGAAGADQRTPDLRSIVQETVNRSGWVSGNAMAFIITGTGHRTARSLEGSASGAPLLHIEIGGAPPANVAPAVAAGPDQTLTLPASASLDGTVSDDGLPNPPATVTTTWSKVSGPGTVTFGNANAVDTPASFGAAGTYVLQLTASDSELGNSDQVTITAQSTPPPNAAPSVDAGPDQTITLPASAALDGTVSDDGLPNPPATVTTTWSKVSGPGSVTFGNASAVDTPASFGAAGTYVLRLAASDSELGNSDLVTITVQPEPPGGGTTFEKRVAANTDDAEEPASLVPSLNSSDLEFVRDGTDQVVGMRFTGVTIPRNATITRAYIQFTTDEAYSTITSLQVLGQAVGNAPTFTTATGNVSTRTRTSASVAWAPPAWTVVGEAGANQRTPELKSVIQEVVDRGDWNSGNALVIIVTGTGRRTASAYDGVPGQAPLLHVEYQ